MSQAATLVSYRQVKILLSGLEINECGMGDNVECQSCCTLMMSNEVRKSFSFPWK